ncbi:MAG: hypothetical protein HY542_01420 [Deltaproteobacteria bacterium]|nr:hypothetical protein [Deltaproteobacteria bacterium]
MLLSHRDARLIFNLGRSYQPGGPDQSLSWSHDWLVPSDRSELADRNAVERDSKRQVSLLLNPLEES